MSKKTGQPRPTEYFNAVMPSFVRYRETQQVSNLSKRVPVTGNKNEIPNSIDFVSDVEMAARYALTLQQQESADLSAETKRLERIVGHGDWETFTALYITQSLEEKDVPKGRLLRIKSRVGEKLRSMEIMKVYFSNPVLEEAKELLQQ